MFSIIKWTIKRVVPVVIPQKIFPWPSLPTILHTRGFETKRFLPIYFCCLKLCLLKERNLLWDPSDLECNSLAPGLRETGPPSGWEEAEFDQSGSLHEKHPQPGDLTIPGISETTKNNNGSNNCPQHHQPTLLLLYQVREFNIMCWNSLSLLSQLWLCDWSEKSPGPAASAGLQQHKWEQQWALVWRWRGEPVCHHQVS